MTATAEQLFLVASFHDEHCWPYIGENRVLIQLSGQLSGRVLHMAGLERRPLQR